MISYSSYALRQPLAPVAPPVLVKRAPSRPSAPRPPTARERVYAVLVASAEAGEVCPSNAELTERSGSSCVSSVADALHWLVETQQITVEQRKSMHSRVVKILATGKATREPQSAREATEERALEVLAEAAEAGGYCPTNLEIGERIGTSHSTAADAVAGLCWRGLIAIERPSYRLRIVTILATGKRTAANRREAA